MKPSLIEPQAGGLIVREKEPLNLEMPFGSLDSFITPNERFYVRCHFPIPEIDAKKWRLKIEGEVNTPLELSLDEIRAMKTRTITATIECAGNGRVFLMPQVKGDQWERGAVGNAEWTGIPLSSLLERAGVKSSACEVILQGADQGEIKDPPRPAGKIHFARSVPLGKANDDVLLALEMNGNKLTLAHGFPVRAVVPGWYGVASIKWLERVIVSARPFRGHFQTIDYSFWERIGDLPTQLPITEMQVKAVIARPEVQEVIPAGEPYRIHGAAWSSNAEVTKVEVSFDWGATWNEAQLLDDTAPDAWRLWEYEWAVPAQPGKATLMARATDSRGRTQPCKRVADFGTYMINHLLPIDVQIA